MGILCFLLEGRMRLMLNKRFFLFMIIAALSFPAFAQEQAEQLSIGKNETFRSEILNEERNVHIFLPAGYSRSGERFPVLYTFYMDASDFHFNTGLVAGMSRMRIIPGMITVSVDLGDARRDLTPTSSEDYGPTSGGADVFLDFMKKELVPFVEKNYRTAPRRMFWSHSIGGLFGLYALLREPDLFQSVLVSSPWMVYDRDQRYILKNAESFFEGRNGQTNFLYICVGDEKNLIPEIEQFISILEKKKPEGLTWEFLKMPKEDHQTILVRSLIEGLRAAVRNKQQ
jgi:predicted alpha/beta superfamily hydrolase